MVLRVFFFAFLLLFGCSEYDFSNPLDPNNNLCGGEMFSPINKRCGAGNVIETRCGSEWYNKKTHFCTPDGVEELGNSILDFRDDKIYKTVQIGTQTWMAENLNYDVPSNTTDVCYDNNASNCATYGRLYNWATAMGLNSNCNNSICANQVQSKHRGICPEGWHIPSYDEWSQLFDYVDVGDGGVAGKHLKAKIGWSRCGPSSSGSFYSCEDTHGFSALPGGYGNSNGRFYDVGNNGNWWDANESYMCQCAGLQNMRYDSELARGYINEKTSLYSVRCVQD